MVTDIEVDFSPMLSRPSFISGFSSMITWAGPLNTYKRYSSGAEADAEAIWFDWTKVGQDLSSAINRIRKEIDVKAQK